MSHFTRLSPLIFTLLALTLALSFTHAADTPVETVAHIVQDAAHAANHAGQGHVHETPAAAAAVKPADTPASSQSPTTETPAAPAAPATPTPIPIPTPAHATHAASQSNPPIPPNHAAHQLHTEAATRQATERAAAASHAHAAHGHAHGHDAHAAHGAHAAGHAEHSTRFHVRDPHAHHGHAPGQVIQHGSHNHTIEDAEQHGGLIFSVLFFVMIGAQLALFVWKKYHLRSFENATILGLWLVPAIWSMLSGFWRMLLVWTAFSSLCGYIIKLAMAKPLQRSTPRKVYTFFYYVYKICYSLAFVGYLMIMCDFFGISLLLPAALTPLAPAGFMLCFYGLYYGVLGRDLANVCSTYMAHNLGYYSKEGIAEKNLPVNICAICDSELTRSVRLSDASTAADETIYTLNCGHKFHEFCLRGWTIIGKRDSCAYCCEKVQLRKTFQNPCK